MMGMRKLAALRSKNTKPKVMVRTQISLVSYFIREVPQESTLDSKFLFSMGRV